MMMDLPPTYVTKIPYEQRTTVVSVASREAITKDRASSGIQAYGVYAEPQPNETPLFSTPISIIRKETVADDINAERMELLAEKYVSERWTREMEARLQIDHRKVERLYPRVTAEQVQALAEIRKQFKESGADAAAMLDELGIR
jgi:hypothetical protein